MSHDTYQTEEEFLQKYDPSIFDRPSTSVDTIIFTIINEDLHVLTVKRAEHPYKGVWSLVGGYIDLQKDIDLEATAKRKLEEKTGVKTPYLEQLSTFGSKTRDPRGWSVTTVYFALIPSDYIQLRLGKGALDIKWSKIVNGKVKDKLAFDHTDILLHCVERLRNKVLYTSLPVYLMPKEFSLRDLQHVYEIILGKNIEHKSFRRRVISANILEETPNFRQDNGRPAQLYRLKKMKRTHFFVRNIEGATLD